MCQLICVLGVCMQIDTWSKWTILTRSMWIIKSTEKASQHLTRLLFLYVMSHVCEMLSFGRVRVITTLRHKRRGQRSRHESAIRIMNSWWCIWSWSKTLKQYKIIAIGCREESSTCWRSHDDSYKIWNWRTRKPTPIISDGARVCVEMNIFFSFNSLDINMQLMDEIDICFMLRICYLVSLY